jgi:hypothetical protein
MNTYNQKYKGSGEVSFEEGHDDSSKRFNSIS